MDDITLIVDIITKLGNNGKEAFLYWLFVTKGTAIICASAFFYLSHKALLITYKLFNQEQQLRELRELMDLCFTDEVTEEHFNCMKIWIQKRK